MRDVRARVDDECQLHLVWRTACRRGQYAWRIRSCPSEAELRTRPFYCLFLALCFNHVNAAGIGRIGNAVAASTKIEQACDRRWLAESGKYADNDHPDFGTLLQRWKKLSGACGDGVVYRARLADIYLSIDDPAGAREALMAVVSRRDSPYYYLVTYALLTADLKEKVQHHQIPNEAQMQEVLRKYEELVAKYPHFTEGYAMLGGLEVIDHDYKQAIGNLEAAARLANGKHSEAGIYRNLTLAYAGSGLYEKAYDAADTAYRARHNLMSDEQFVYAYARAAAGLGKFDDAEAAIRVILARHPEVKLDREFSATIRFVVAKEKENGFQARKQ